MLAEGEDRVMMHFCLYLPPVEIPCHSIAAAFFRQPFSPQLVLML